MTQYNITFLTKDTHNQRLVNISAFLKTAIQSNYFQAINEAFTQDSIVE